MKNFIKLVVLILIGLTLNSCYNSQEKEAIEICKRSCKYPLTFKVMDTYSILIPAKIDTITYSGICYIKYSNSVIDSFKIRYDNFSDYWDHDYYDGYNYDYTRSCKIDSIHTYTIKRDYPTYTNFHIAYFTKNDFGVPYEEYMNFYIINGNVYNSNKWNIDIFTRNIDTISINHFINNSPNKIFEDMFEIEKYLNHFKSNFKLKQ